MIFAGLAHSFGILKTSVTKCLPWGKISCYKMVVIIDIMTRQMSYLCFVSLWAFSNNVVTHEYLFVISEKCAKNDATIWPFSF